MKIVVTGASGLVGYAVTSTLATLGYSVTTVSRHTCGDLDVLNVDQRLGDLSVTSLNELVGDASFDYVVHCAAAIPGTRLADNDVAKINKVIDQNIRDFCISQCAALIYMSTTSVYGHISSIVDEDSSVAPMNEYAQEKLRSEIMFLECNVATSIFRISAPYGIRQKTRTVMQLFLERGLQALTLKYHGSGSRSQDFTHPYDIAVAVAAAIDKRANGVFNIASGLTVSMKNLGSTVSLLFPEKKIEVLASGQLDQQENYRALYSIEKAMRDLAWKPKIDLVEGLKEFAKDLDSRGDS